MRFFAKGGEALQDKKGSGLAYKYIKKVIHSQCTGGS